MRNLTKEELNSEYLIIKNLSADKPYKTYMAMKGSSDGTPITVILKETDEKRADIYQELSGMWNPYLADTYEVLRITDGDTTGPQLYYAVTEYVYAKGSPEEECTSLTRFIRKNGPLDEKVSLMICVQLCEGLKEFHKKGFVHRDLKPDNIMISEYDTQRPQVKIVDFGGAKWNNPTKHSDTTIIGTLGYQAPESLTARTTEQADIYSIGCILNFLLTGHEPGIGKYKGDHYIVNIIETATNDDPSHRYGSVTAMQKQLEHLLGKRLIDRILFIRALPGFRSDTTWKITVGAIGYVSIIALGFFCSQEFSFVESFTGVFLPYIIVPLIFLLNIGNLQRFFPEKLRRNNSLFFKIRIAIVLVAFWEPMMITYTNSNLK